MSHKYNTRNRRKVKQPHPSYYVGYVEDMESVESIMKKFEAMETLKKHKQENKKKNESKENSQSPNRKSKNQNKSKSNKSSKAEISDSDEEEEDIDIEVNNNNNNNSNDSKENTNDNNDELFNEDDLANLFVSTSMFSVNSLKNNNQIFMDKPIVDRDGFVTGYDNTINSSELIFATDYNEINNELIEEHTNYSKLYPNEAGIEYDPDYDLYNLNQDDSDDSDFFKDVLGGNSSGMPKGYQGGNKSRKTLAKEARERNKNKRSIRGKSYGKGKDKSGIRNAPKGYEGLEDIDKHYSYTYGRRLAPLVAGDAERRARALRLRTCSAFYKLIIPKYPMPRSWGHRISRFNGHRDNIKYFSNIKKAKKELMAYNYIKHNDITKLKLTDLPHNEYHAILMDIPWDVTQSLFDPREGMIKWQQLVDLPIREIVPNGMLFVWIPSEILIDVCKMIEHNWGFRQVEHATYVRKSIRNRFNIRKGKFVNHTKENLILFRKGIRKRDTYSSIYEGRIELRHQRTSDAHVNFIRYHKEYKKFELKPNDIIYRMIETLLPDATEDIRFAYKNNKELDKVQSKLLYLWAPKNEIRGGWTMVVDKKHCKYLKNIENDPNYDNKQCKFVQQY